MAEPFATLRDVYTLWRDLNAEEQGRVIALLPVISDELRIRAEFAGRNLDEMIESNSAYANVAKEVTVSIVSRILRMSTTGEPMSQESQAGLGYSWSGTYAVAGGGIGNAIFPSDLKRLGLKRQRYGVLDFYDPRNDSHFME